MNAATVLLFLSAACFAGAIVAYVCHRRERARTRAIIHARLDKLIGEREKTGK